jgi:hypothetical protein
VKVQPGRANGIPSQYSRYVQRLLGSEQNTLASDTFTLLLLRFILQIDLPVQEGTKSPGDVVKVWEGRITAWNFVDWFASGMRVTQHTVYKRLLIFYVLTV